MKYKKSIIRGKEGKADPHLLMNIIFRKLRVKKHKIKKWR